MIITKGMLRKTLKTSSPPAQFSARGTESSRLESFSDGVFALAVALLVLSSSVPETFSELLEAFSDVVPFALCITILGTIWYQHYLFFYRYGLSDLKTVVLNTVLLSVVLFYVYPLKFLFRVLYMYFSKLVTGQPLNDLFTNILPINQAANLLILYGIGAIVIYLILAEMFRHALAKSEELELSDIEKKLTRKSMILNFVSIIPPLLSVLVAWVGVGSYTTTFVIAGNIYWLYPILMPLSAKLLDKES